MHDGDKKFNQHRQNGVTIRASAISTGDAGMEDAMKTGLAICLRRCSYQGYSLPKGNAADEKQGVKDRLLPPKKLAGRGTLFGSTKTVPE